MRWSVSLGPGLPLFPGIGMPELPKPLVRCDQGFLLAPFSVDYEARKTWIILCMAGGPWGCEDRFQDLQQPLCDLELSLVTGLMEGGQYLVR